MELHTYDVDFSKQYKRVVEFNLKAGKFPNKVTDQDIENQQRLVEEEHRELIEAMNEGADKSHVLKELIDVFVVSCYRDFLLFCQVDEAMPSLDEAANVVVSKVNTYDLYVTKHAFNGLINRIDIFRFLKDIIAWTYLSTNYDLIGAMEEVLDNNDAKIFNELETAQEVKIKFFDSDDYKILGNDYKGHTYYTIRRVADNKIMKAPNHPKCDLDKYIPQGDILSE